MFLLGDFGFLLGALQLELPLVLSQPAFADGDLGLGFDLHPRLALLGDHLGEPPHALRVEGVALVQLAQIALVDADQRGRDHDEPQARGMLGHRLCYFRCVAGAVEVDVGQVAPGGGILHGVDQGAGDNLADGVAAPGDPHSQNLGGGGNTFRRRIDPELEFHFDVGAQLIPGQQRFPSLAVYGKRHRPHRDALDLVQDRQGETAAIDDDPPAPETGTDKRGVQCRLGVIALQEPDRDDQQKRNGEQRKKPDQGQIPQRHDDRPPPFETGGIGVTSPWRNLFSFSSKMFSNSN